jgi:DNA-binding NarL/FixJ family response regulator
LSVAASRDPCFASEIDTRKVEGVGVDFQRLPSFHARRTAPASTRLVSHLPDTFFLMAGVRRDGMMARITRAMKPPATLALVDDDPAVRDLWTRQFARHRAFIITGIFADAESALPKLLAAPPAIVLVDWKLPGPMDGLALVARLKAAHSGVRAVLVTNHDLDELPLAVLRAGVNGCLLKPDSPAALPVRLRAVMDGTCVLSARIMQRLAEQFHAGPPASAETMHRLASLTPREREVLHAFARGLPAKLVADLLQISEATVKTHKEHIVLKLGVQGFMEAVARFAPYLD